MHRFETGYTLNCAIMGIVRVQRRLAERAANIEREVDPKEYLDFERAETSLYLRSLGTSPIEVLKLVSLKTSARFAERVFDGTFAETLERRARRARAIEWARDFKPRPAA